MPLRFALTILLALGGMSQAGLADTITFPDGATMDGRVREVNENCLELTVGDNTIQFERSEIASVEKNDKKGDTSKPLVLPQVKAWEEEMDQKTGMNGEQREKFYALLDAMRSTSDPIELKRLEDELVALNKKVDVVKLIKTSYESASIGRRMLFLAMLDVLSPQAALPYLEEGMNVNNARFRAYSIEMYESILRESKGVDRKALTYFARGILDLDVDVQLAAGNALAESGDKPVTPVLLAKLDAADPRLKNVVNRALAHIWNVDPQTITEDPKTYWQSQWQSNQASVKDPIDPEKLEPLVDKDAPVEDAHH